MQLLYEYTFDLNKSSNDYSCICPVFNSLSARQTNRRFEFANIISTCLFFDENFFISINFHIFVPGDSIDKKTKLVPIITWCRIND